MKTEIEFLRELEDDLMEAAEASLHPPHAGRSIARSPRMKVAFAASFLALAAGVGYYVTNGLPGQSSRSFAPSSRVLAGMAPSPSPTHGSLTGVQYRILTDALAGLQDTQVPLAGPQVVKTARLSVVVPRGQFGDAFEEASLVASRYAGFVESSSTQGSESRSGRLTIRVPTAGFDRALADLRGLGRVDGEETAGQDVTAEYVDLQARLRTFQATEEVLLRLLDRSTTVADTLRVQRELHEVQLRIEQLTGQLRVLQGQTEMATVSLSIRETGVPAEEQGADQGGPSLVRAWDATVDGFLSVLFAMLIGLGYLVPIAVAGALIWVAWRRLRPRAVA